MRGDRLRWARERTGMSQSDLARAARVTQGQILRYENGQNSPSSVILTKLSRELDVSADFLLGLVDEPQARVTPADLSPLELRFMAAADRGDIIEMMKTAMQIYDEYHPDAKEQPSSLGKAGKGAASKGR